MSRPAAKRKAPADSRVAAFARDMAIAAIAATGPPADPQSLRQLVRLSREFWSEVDQPTKPAVKKAKPAPAEEEDEGAEMVLEDE